MHHLANASLFSGNLIPHVICEKKWNQESDDRSQSDLTWVNSILRITFNYGVSSLHPFKAYVLDTSNGQKKTFALLIEDQNHCDAEERMEQVELKVDLKDFAQPGTVFKVMNLVNGNRALVLGETTYKSCT
jgi:hypothetical protein